MNIALAILIGIGYVAFMGIVPYTQHRRSMWERWERTQWSLPTKPPEPLFVDD